MTTHTQSTAVTAMLDALRAVVLDLATRPTALSEATVEKAVAALALGETTALTEEEVKQESEAFTSPHRKMNRVNLKAFIEEHKGKLVSLDFTKLNNQARTFTGRLGVTAPLKGGENKSEAAERPYLTMYDIQAQDYRNVNLATVTQIRAIGCTFDIID